MKLLLFFPIIMLYLMVPSLKLFASLWTHFGAYLLVEALLIYHNYYLMLIVRTTSKRTWSVVRTIVDDGPLP
jgi:hypothetical protein